MKKRSKQPSQVPPLDDRHYLAIELLISIDGKRPNRTKIAKKCQVSRMQLYRWELRKDFQLALDKRARQLINRKYPRKYEIAQMAINGDIEAAKLMLSAADVLF